MHENVILDKKGRRDEKISDGYRYYAVRTLKQEAEQEA